MLLHGAPDQPEHWRPETDEERAALRVTALALVDRPGANPEAYTQENVQNAEYL